jgi:hypothetical protein
VPSLLPPLRSLVTSRLAEVDAEAETRTNAVEERAGAMVAGAEDRCVQF